MLMSNGADLDENGPRDEPDSPPEIRLYGMIQPSGGGDYIPASDCVSSKPPYILHLEKLSAGIAWPSFLVDIRNCLWLAQQWHLVRGCGALRNPSCEMWLSQLGAPLARQLFSSRLRGQALVPPSAPWPLAPRGHSTLPCSFPVEPT